MQALSFIVHIPLVCFGIAFPVMVLFAEGRWLRTGDPVYRELARRWSRVMIGLFAVGVITGTILSFEMGLLWPNFTATFGSVFGLGFAIEGFSFFMEAIFIGIYVYGWNRLSPRTHLLSGIPIVITGFTGSLMVISVNAWMQHPGGFTLRHGKVVSANPWSALFGNDYLWHELLHMYVAGYMVTGFVVAGVYGFARLRGRWGRYERAGLAIPLTIAVLASIAQAPIGDWAARDVATNQPVKLWPRWRALQDHSRSVGAHLLGWYTVNGPDQVRDPDPASLVAAGLPQLERRRQGPRYRALANAAAAGQCGADRGLPDHGWLIGTAAGAVQPVLRSSRAAALQAGLAGVGLVLPESWWPPDRWPWIALITGWVVTEVGRQPWVVYHVMLTSAAVTGAPGIPVGYGALIVAYVGVAFGVAWMLRRLARRPLELEPEYR